MILMTGTSFPQSSHTRSTVIPAAMLMGATFLMMVDDIARLATASEIPLGILTSFVGAPVFLSSGDAVPFDLPTPQAFSAFLGFAVRVADKTPDTYPSGQNSADAQSGVWKSGDVMEILVRGGISVPMANAGTKGGALYIRKSDGKLTTAAGTEGTTVLLENVRVRNTRSGADGCGEVIVSRRNLL